jgi:hypothetical protein
VQTRSIGVRVVIGVALVAVIVLGTWGLQRFLTDRPETWTTAVIVVATSAIIASVLAMLIVRLRGTEAATTAIAAPAVAQARPARPPEPPPQHGETRSVDWAALAPLVAERVAQLPEDVRQRVLTLNDKQPASWRAWRLEDGLVRVTIGADDLVEIGVFEIAESSEPPPAAGAASVPEPRSTDGA